MTVNDRFKERYKSGDTPWDVGKPDFNLIEVVTQNPIPGCSVLEVGCGTGDNSIWLAQNGFEVKGIDASDIAINKAIQKAREANAKCDFIVADFLKADIYGAPFGFVFDRGCFHSFDSAKDRKNFAQKVAAHLEEAGLWLTLVGNADEDRQGEGPPQRSAGDIVSAVEPCFEILSLQSSHFESNFPEPPRAWRCLMKKRPYSTGATI
jgi:SAM-dependent methyltransferase